MKKHEVKKLFGVYRIWWKSGGSSVASIGRDSAGNVWIAPANWITVPTFDKKYWRDIRKVTKLS